MSFIAEFDTQYAPKLGKRAGTFRTLFDLMEKKASCEPINIIETGCLRIPDNWEGDGQSSFMMDRFLHHYNSCQLDIYDISPHSVAACKRFVTHPNTRVHCMDSVVGLWEYARPVDVLYLDSYDVDFNNTHPSAFHHIKELCSIMKKIAPGALVMVDDNMHNKGKGQYIHEFMRNINADVVMNDYQILFQMPK